MAPRFLLKTDVPADRVLGGSQGPVLHGYDRLQAALQQRFGPAGAALFSEPVFSRTNESASVSWYSDIAGTASPLSSLPADRRVVLQARLRDDLARLAPALNDAELGPQLRHALCVRSPDSLYAIGDRVVLTEWGLVPDGAEGVSDAAELLRHSAIAPFLGSPDQPAARSSPASPAAAPTAAPLPTRPALVPTASARPIRGRGIGAAWLAIPAALALAALFLGLGYWRGALLANDRAASRPNTVSVVDVDAARRDLAQQEAMNAALERQIEDRRKLLAGNVCVADPDLLPRIGPDRAAAPPPAVVPTPPGGQPFQGNLADLLKQAIVMVVVKGREDGFSVGTGFFVAPDLVVTNRHVVEASAGGDAVVVNTKLGHVLRGQVSATTPNSDIGSLDLALIRVQAQANVQPLAFTTTASELDPVIAAGYPALITRTDAGMQRLMQDGDLTAAPQLILTDGRIQAIQDSPGGIKIMPHGAAISGGSSGGPLVDGCGRVVGINTFIRTDAETTAHANYAQKTDSILPFLSGQGVAVTQVGGPCSPGGPALASPAAPGGASPAPASLAPSSLAPANTPPAR